MLRAVQLPDLLSVFFHYEGPLQLHRCSKHIVFWSPEIGNQGVFFGGFKICEPLLLALCSASLGNSSQYSLIAAEFWEVSINSELCGKVHNTWLLWANQANGELTTSLAVAHRHVHKFTELECSLNLCECHILAVWPLPKVLFAVDDFKCAIGPDLSNVATTEEPDAINSNPVFCILLLKFFVWPGGTDKVTLAHRRATNEDLPAAHAELWFILVRVHVVSLWPIRKPHNCTDCWRTDAGRAVITPEGNTASCARLCETIALSHGNIKDCLTKFLDVWRQGRRASQHHFEASAHDFLDLLENNTIVDAVGANLPAPEMPLTRGQAP
mmetsp:Transcript_122926/g.244519  ORF Transcript_122926/g.244519 Transcript_122926/m.244519 type:complete len:326 (+) Transcript_122926:300-1277(+)